jgi:transposase
MRKIPTVKDASKNRAPAPSNSTTTLGLDLGDRRSHVCVLDLSGAVVERLVVDSTASAMGAAFASRRGALVVMEAGGHSPWVSRLLSDLGLRVIVANPNQLAAITKSDRKTDRNDAEMLARLGRADLKLLRPLEHRSASKQAHLEMLKARDALVRSRTLQVNHVRGALKSFGVRAPSCDAATFASKAAEYVPEELRPAIQPLLAVIALLTKSIGRYDRLIERLCKKVYPETALLRQVQGVGPLTSLAFVLVLGSAERFEHSRQVGPYLGLVPRAAQSGEQDPQLHITKAGNGFMRKLLVQSAHYITGPFAEDSTLRRLGLHLMSSGGARGKKRAIIAVARRLAVILHCLWKTGETYDRLRHAPKAIEPVAAVAATA